MVGIVDRYDDRRPTTDDRRPTTTIKKHRARYSLKLQPTAFKFQTKSFMVLLMMTVASRRSRQVDNGVQVQDAF